MPAWLEGVFLQFSHKPNLQCIQIEHITIALHVVIKHLHPIDFGSGCGGVSLLWRETFFTLPIQTKPYASSSCSAMRSHFLVVSFLIFFPGVLPTGLLLGAFGDKFIALSLNSVVPRSSSSAASALLSFSRGVELARCCAFFDTREGDLELISRSNKSNWRRSRSFSASSSTMRSLLSTGSS